MDELTTITASAADEFDVLEAGSTVALGGEGWETAEYVDPGDDWQLLPDGSYLSPDGTLRSWPLSGPEPA